MTSGTPLSVTAVLRRRGKASWRRLGPEGHAGRGGDNCFAAEAASWAGCLGRCALGSSLGKAGLRPAAVAGLARGDGLN
jgi:hypothetical protein